jgi:hypothetical protein
MIVMRKEVKIMVKEIGRFLKRYSNNNNNNHHHHHHHNTITIYITRMLKPKTMDTSREHSSKIKYTIF